MTFESAELIIESAENKEEIINAVAGFAMREHGYMLGANTSNELKNDVLDMVDRDLFQCAKLAVIAIQVINRRFN